MVSKKRDTIAFDTFFFLLCFFFFFFVFFSFSFCLFFLVFVSLFFFFLVQFFFLFFIFFFGPKIGLDFFESLFLFILFSFCKIHQNRFSKKEKERRERENGTKSGVSFSLCDHFCFVCSHLLFLYS